MSSPFAASNADGASSAARAPHRWAIVRGAAGMGGLILLLLAGVTGWLQVVGASPAREAAMGLLRERPEVAAALGMPLERSLAINVFDVLPFLEVEGTYRYLMLLHGPEGWGVGEVHLSPVAPGLTSLRFRKGPLGAWQPLPRALTPERPLPEAAAKMQHALTLLQGGKSEQARDALTEVLQLQPLVAAAWYLRAVASRDLGHDAAALADARRALALEHPDPELVVLFEQVLPEDASPFERVVAWSNFLDHAPHSSVALARHAKARVEAGRDEGALRYLEERCRQESAEACQCLRELVEAKVVPLSDTSAAPEAAGP